MNPVQRAAESAFPDNEFSTIGVNLALREAFVKGWRACEGYSPGPVADAEITQSVIDLILQERYFAAIKELRIVNNGLHLDAAKEIVEHLKSQPRESLTMRGTPGRKQDLLPLILLLSDDAEQANSNDSEGERLRKIALLISEAYGYVEDDEQAEEAQALRTSLLRDIAVEGRVSH